jgi:hypothetical protein
VKLADFARSITVGDTAPPPRAPRIVLYIPPYGRAVHCPDRESAERAATKWASENPGRTVAVYELVGFAHQPVRPTDFTPADSDEAMELRDVTGDDVVDTPVDGVYDKDGDVRDARGHLTDGQQETLARLREIMVDEDQGAKSP